MEVELTLDDITQVVVLVEINGNAHQVLLSNEDKQVVKIVLANLPGGMNLSKQMEPVSFEFKKENPQLS